MRTLCCKLMRQGWQNIFYLKFHFKNIYFDKNLMLNYFLLIKMFFQHAIFIFATFPNPDSLQCQQDGSLKQSITTRKVDRVSSLAPSTNSLTQVNFSHSDLSSPLSWFAFVAESSSSQCN